jgi:hypothetical protein
VRPSSRLATIARYGHVGEFTNMTSFNVKPPNINCTFSSGGSSESICMAGWEARDGDSEAGSTVKEDSEGEVSPSEDAVSEEVAAGDAFGCPSAVAALRFPLRSFFFHHPWSVW